MSENITSEGQRRRLKQKDLVAALFVLFSEEYDSRGADSILDLEIPMSELRRQLRERVGIDYTSDAWISTQLHKYEEEIGVSLFRKVEREDGSLSLGIARDMRTYFQKQHLYVTQKIRVANGVFDLIRNDLESGPKRQALTILLGAGSTVSRIAELVAENARSLGWTWRVATHNLGVIQTLGKPGPFSDRVELFVPEGRVDPVLNIILGRNRELYSGLELDWVVEGASFLVDGELFVENEDETRVKREILALAAGKKILVLTGHETRLCAPPGMSSHGRIEDYDFIVLPRSTRAGLARSRFALAIRDLEALFEPWVLNWNYEIFKVRKR
jgi:DeoR/GlpR family transcriptional regulator of sugar metabolism